MTPGRRRTAGAASILICVLLSTEGSTFAPGGALGTAGLRTAFGHVQEKLDPKNDLLTQEYIQSDLVGRYGYLELDYPEAFKTDGRGSLKTKPALESQAQVVPDNIREWIRDAAPALQRNPNDKVILGQIVRALGVSRLYTRLVPYADRWIALGGKLGITETDTYVGGLARLGRASEARDQYQKALKQWGTMASGISARMHEDLFMYSWLVERNFRDMLEAHDQGMLNGISSHDASFMQETLCSMLRTAAKQDEEEWFVSRMDRHWIWLNEVYVKQAIEVLELKKHPVPDSLLAALDPLFKGAVVPPQALLQRATDSLDRGEADKSLRQAERAKELSQALSLERQFDALEILTRVLRQRDDVEQAFDATDELERIAKQINKAPVLGWTLIMKAFLLEKVGDYKGAVALYVQADKVGQSLGYDALYYQAERCTRRALSRIGMAIEVEPKLRESALRATDKRLTALIPIEYSFWGECLLQMGSYTAALKAFRQALVPVQDAGSEYKIELAIQLTCLKGIGFALCAQKSFQEAEAAYDDYGKLAQKALGASSAWVWQLGKAKCRRGLNKPDEAQHWIEECLKSIEAERAHLKDFQQRLTLNDNKYEAYEVAIHLALERGDEEAAFRIAERSRSRAFLDVMGIHSSEAKGIELQDLPTVAAACPDLCTVVYYQLPDRLLAWVISKGKGELVSIPLTEKEVRDLVHHFLTTIYLQSQILKDRVTALSGLADANQVSKKVFDAIWAPIQSRVPPGMRICIIPHRSLHYVPFQALNDGEHYLIEGRDVLYAPSASALLALRKRKHEARDGSLIMDPILSDDPKSPFAKTESVALQAQYPSGKFFLRGTATVAAFKEQSPMAGVVHISSHGYYNPWIPLESGLLFAGPEGKGNQILRARDIYPMNLEKTRLIVMSACVSSVGDFANGDEVTGLTRAFQVAGVPNVVGSLWPVENAATTQLMILFHRNLAETQDPASALRKAQSELIERKVSIARWGAFVLTGTGLSSSGR